MFLFASTYVAKWDGHIAEKEICAQDTDDILSPLSHSISGMVLQKQTGFLDLPCFFSGKFHFLLSGFMFYTLDDR